MNINTNTNEINRLKICLEKGAGDPLYTFVAQKEADELCSLREQNLEMLFTVARKYKVRFLYVGAGEIAGCESIKEPGSNWPAMWAIALEVGFPGSCGNSDQYQCRGSQHLFPKGAYGGWDLKTNTKLTDEETEAKKFCRVVTRKNR